MRSSVAPQGSSASSAERDEINATLCFTGPPLLDDVEEHIPATPLVERNSATSIQGASFRGIPVDVPEHTTRAQIDETNRAAYLASTEPRGPRGRIVFQDNEHGSPRTQYT